MSIISRNIIDDFTSEKGVRIIVVDYVTDNGDVYRKRIQGISKDMSRSWILESEKYDINILEQAQERKNDKIERLRINKVITGIKSDLSVILSRYNLTSDQLRRLIE